MKTTLLIMTLLLSACTDMKELQKQVNTHNKPTQKTTYNINELKIYAFKEAVKNEISPIRFINQLKIESNFNTYAIGKADEIGIGQIKPSTAKEFCLIDNPEDLKNPYINIQCAARIKSVLAKKYKSERKAEKHYNGGFKCVKNKCKQVEAYINKIDKIA